MNTTTTIEIVELQAAQAEQAESQVSTALRLAELALCELDRVGGGVTVSYY